MKMIKILAMAAVCSALPIWTMAVPLDITETGGTPEHLWGGPLGANYGLTYEDVDVVQDVSGPPASINLAGVNSIQVTWNAPAGYMYVVNPPPSDELGPLSLAFETAYGFNGGPATSLGSVTASSVSVNMVYGSLPFTGGVSLNNPGFDGGPGVEVGAGATISSGTAPFAFTSITVLADFSGTSPSGTLDRTSIDNTSAYFGILYGGPVDLAPGTNPYNLTDPGPLLTLEPLPTGSVPEVPSTFFLAGMSFAAFWLCRRKLSTVNS